MARNRLMLDLAQCEVFNHLPPMKAGVLIKAITDYWMTGEVSPWGVDVDLKPIFMTFRATLEKKSESARASVMQRWHRDDTNDTNVHFVSDQETESERDGDEEKRTKREEEEEKAKGKEPNKEKINITIYEKKANKQTELFEPEEAHTEAKEPQFRKPSLAEVADYVKEKGYEQWVDPEAFWSYHENGDWMAGRKKMKSWHLAITTWMRKSKEREERMQIMRQQRTPHGTSVGERAYNMLHFEYEGHPEMWKEEEKKIAELQKYF